MTSDDLDIPDILRRTPPEAPAPEEQVAATEPEETLEELEARITTLMGNDVANRIGLGKALRKVQAKLKDNKLWLAWIEKMGYGQRQVYRLIKTADGAHRVDRLVDKLSTRCIADVLQKIDDFSDDTIKRAATEEGRINYDLLRNIAIVRKALCINPPLVGTKQIVGALEDIAVPPDKTEMALRLAGIEVDPAQVEEIKSILNAIPAQSAKRTEAAYKAAATRDKNKKAKQEDSRKKWEEKQAKEEEDTDGADEDRDPEAIEMEALSEAWDAARETARAKFVVECLRVTDLEDVWNDLRQAKSVEDLRELRRYIEEMLPDEPEEPIGEGAPALN
jgi:hypothetical protein